MAITDLSDGDVLDEGGWQSVIDTVESTTTGHDHDGTDSKYIVAGALNVDVTAIDTATYSTTGVWATKKTYTFTPAGGVNSVILGMKLTWDMQQANNNDMASLRVYMDDVLCGTGVAVDIIGPVIGMTSDVWTAKEALLLDATGLGHVYLPVMNSTTYSIVVQTQTTTGGAPTFSCNIKNLQLTVYWMKVGTVTTNSGLITS
jgi:hypothetical protein